LGTKAETPWKQIQITELVENYAILAVEGAGTAAGRIGSQCRLPPGEAIIGLRDW
jgi:hypothetical protein